ncbi:MAG: LEA type 2 family protein [Planctomycetota bacterium]
MLVLLIAIGCQTVEKPTAFVRGAKLDSVAVDRFTIGVDVAVTNPNTFDLPLPMVDYEMSIREVELLEGQANTANLVLPAGQTRSVTVPITVRYQALLELTDALLATGGEFDYRLEGEARFRPPGLPGLLGTVSAPFAFDGKLPLREALRDPKTLADPNGRRLAGELFRRFFEGR